MIGPRPGVAAPSLTLPLRYLVTATAAFVLAAAGLPSLAGELAGHYYQPRVLALTHTVGLGWITVAIMGASYQLLPVVLERPVWSERLARWQFAVVLTAVTGMVAHFWLATWGGLVWAAGLMGVGVGLHALNVGMTVRRPERWTVGLAGVVLALAGLSLTALFGVTLAASHVWAFALPDRLALLHAHFHLALLGWIAPMVVGVATRVYPMFLLAPPPGRLARQLQLWGLGVGAPTLVVGLVAVPALVLPGALAAAVAVLAHAAWVIAAAWRRKRPRLDWGLRFVLAGIACLVAATALGLGLAAGRLEGPRPALAYAALALGGWVSLTIAGMLLKIVPFLVWYHVYGRRVGREPVPALGQLAWPVMDRLAFGLLGAGVPGIAAALGAGSRTWIRVAGTILAAGAGALGATLGRSLAHLAGRRARRPEPRPAGATAP